MPVINYETVRFKRAERLKVTQRITALGIRMNLIFDRLAADGSAITGREYNALVSEYRILERNYNIMQKEYRKLSCF